LPALSGEKTAFGMQGPPADRDAPPPMASPAAAVIEIVEITEAEAGAAAAVEAPAAGNGAGPPETPPAWIDDGAAAQPEPAGAAVRTVTQKPANPRRGWWQRLMQP